MAYINVALNIADTGNVNTHAKTIFLKTKKFRIYWALFN